MATYARMVNGVAIDVTGQDPKTIFHPDIAKTFVTVPDTVSAWDKFDGNTWSKYIAPTAKV